MKNFYITTTLPYVNADPHIGFALEIVQADTLARYQRQQGNEVFFNTGTDEHGLKIYRKAEEQEKDPQAYVDEYAAKFDNLKKALNLSYNAFIRTTNEKHIKAVQEFWQRCDQAGDIYKKNYKVKYCVGCESEKTESELEDGHCPFHPQQKLEAIEEENYFFKFSKYQDRLLKLYEDNPNFVVPAWRLNEIKNFVAGGLKDFSISRLKKKMPWGVEVPGDPEHVMYVWFDALVNYISTLQWPTSAKASAEKPDKKGNFKKFWPGMQVAGKDNLRQQSAMWQAMLMSAGLPCSTQILIHGFVNSNGQKMSKSLGNMVDPYKLVEQYGTDALRYYLLAEVDPFEDSDFTTEKFEARYNADLANGLGNLTARVSNLLEKNKIELNLQTKDSKKLKQQINKAMQEFKFNEALKIIWDQLRKSDEKLSKEKPWELDDVGKIKIILEPIAQDILNVAELFLPFLPETAGKIIEQFSAKQIKKGEVLFPRV